MELDITHLVEDGHDACPVHLLSGSRMELGPDAGTITWTNSMRQAQRQPLLTADRIDEGRDYFRDFGAWTDEEIAAWPAEEVQALVVQYVAGDIREMQGCHSYEQYRDDAERGRVSGNVYRADDGRWFFSLTR